MKINNSLFRKNRIVSFILLVLMIFAIASLGACSIAEMDIHGQSDTTDSISSDAEAQNSSAADDAQWSDTDSAGEALTDSEGSGTDDVGGSTLQFMSEYKPYKAFDENGAEKPINFVYGTGYATYGGALCFLDDGTFTAYLGVGADDGSSDGTYKFISDTEIEMSFGNGDVEVATITEVSGNNIIELKLFNRGFDVVFRSAG